MPRAFSCSVVSDSLPPNGLQPARLLCPWDFQVRILESAAIFLLQGIFPTQGSNLCLCISCIYRGILYHCTTREVPLMGQMLEI